MNEDIKRELRMMGIMIPKENEYKQEDLRYLRLSKDYYNRPELDLNGEPPW
jgi:hypothetical protein